MTDLEEVQMLTRKLCGKFLNYAIKKLNGNRAPKQADYDKLVAGLFGVKEGDTS